MKKIILTTLFTCLLSTGSFANNSSEGYVRVNPDFSLTGSMNVRYNDDVVGRLFTIVTESSITFYGVDDEWEGFSCIVSESSQMYEYARDIANNLSDGSLLYVRKDTGVPECTYLNHRKFSTYQQ